MWWGSPSTFLSGPNRLSRVAEDRGRRRPTSALAQGCGALGAGVTAVGVVAGVLLVATLFMTITSVDVANGSCEVINDANPDLADRCSLSGFERHGARVRPAGAARAW